MEQFFLVNEYKNGFESELTTTYVFKTKDDRDIFLKSNEIECKAVTENELRKIRSDKEINALLIGSAKKLLKKSQYKLWLADFNQRV